MIKKVLLIGGTGMLGSVVARTLAKENFEVRLLARNKEKALRLFGDSVEIRVGDVTDVESIWKALEGVDAVYISLSSAYELKGVQNTVKAAEGLPLQRIAYISGTSVAKENIWFPLIKEKYFAEQAIFESGIPYTIFRPAWFFESLPNFVREGKAIVFGRQRNLYHFVAAEDYAKMVANSFRLDSAVNKTFYIHGPKGYYFKDAVAKYAEAFYPEIKGVTELPHFVASVIAFLRGSKEMKFANDFMKYFGKVGELGDPSEANEILGAPKTTLEEWIEKRRSK